MEQDKYEQKYTYLIIANVTNNALSKERVAELEQEFAAEPEKDPPYLASLQEALKLLYTPEELMIRQRDREKPQEQPVECEACGKMFLPSSGYYEEGEYSYCPDCCHW